MPQNEPMTAKRGKKTSTPTRGAGPQTHISGDVLGPVLSGNFSGPVNFGSHPCPETVMAPEPGALAQGRQEPERVDVVILTVLSEEFEAFRRRMPDARQWPGTRGCANVYAWHHAGVPRSDGGGTYRVALGMTGRAGTNASAAATIIAVGLWRPRYVVFAGIAGGLGKTQKGDVIIADTVFGYEYGKIEGGRFTPRSDWTTRTDSALFTGASAYAAKPGWRCTLRTEPPTPVESIVRPESVVSGDKVVDDPSYDFFRAVLAAYPAMPRPKFVPHNAWRCRPGAPRSAY